MAVAHTSLPSAELLNANDRWACDWQLARSPFQFGSSVSCYAKGFDGERGMLLLLGLLLLLPTSSSNTIVRSG